MHHVGLPAVMGAHEFSVSVHDLDAGGKHLCVAVRSAWLQGALEGTEAQGASTDGALDVRVSRSGTDVVVRGTLKAELTVACARCLEPARIAISEAVSALFVPPSVSHAGAVDGSEDESAADQVDVHLFDGETVVLDDLVRDELLLGMPMIPLCSESCPGIRPEGIEREPRLGLPDPRATEDVDPRFRPLLRLKKRLT